MSDARKVDAAQAPQGDKGQALLASGERLALRLWEEAPGDGKQKQVHAHDYETVGYVLEGRAELVLEGETVELSEGDSWVVPPGAEHTYRIATPFRAVEATAPPARRNG